MGKPTGFLEYPRALPADRPPRERLGDWREFHRAASEDSLRLQGARCLDCGTPFCHSGLLLGGMASGCPLGNLIPEWNDLIYRGLWQAALQRLLRTNDFPEFTGRVCPAPCEGACALGINDDPVTTKANEYALIEMAFAAGWIVPRPPSRRTGKKVAVIGSGPAGLACAMRLNRAGHLVTVFERADRPGGLLMYGIPQMKLDKGIVLRRLDLMAAEGISFLTGTEVGVDFPPDRLGREFDAVVLCGGAGRPRDLTVPGRDLEGIHFALDYLTANTRNLLDPGGEDGRLVSAARQGCRRDRGRRHRHGLCGHRAAARLPKPVATGNTAGAALRADRRQSLAAMAADRPGRLRPGGSLGGLRPGSPRLLRHDQGLHG